MDFELKLDSVALEKEKYMKVKNMFLTLRDVDESDLGKFVTNCKINKLSDLFILSTPTKTYLYQTYGEIASGTYNCVNVSNKSIVITHDEPLQIRLNMALILNRLTSLIVPSRLYTNDELRAIYEHERVPQQITSFYYENKETVLRKSANRDDRTLNLCENTFNVILYRKCQELVVEEKLPYNPIIRPLNLFEDDGIFITVMEKKQNLKNYLEVDLPIRFEHVVVQIIQVLKILEKEIYFIHGDLKYDNIVMDGDNICFIDFGFTSFVLDKTKYHTDNFDRHVTRAFELSYTDLAFFLLTCFAYTSSVNRYLTPIITRYIKYFFRNSQEIIKNKENLLQFCNRYCNTLNCNGNILEKNPKVGLSINAIEDVIRIGRVILRPPPPPVPMPTPSPSIPETLV